MVGRLKLARNCAGAATIELALIAPVLLGMLIGLIDLGTTYSNKLRLEQVAQRTIEKVQAKTFNSTMETALETEAAAAAGAGAVADVTYWLECNGTKMTGAGAYTAGCSTGQTYARYVQLSIQRNYMPLLVAHFGTYNANGSVTLHGKAGIRIQ